MSYQEEGICLDPQPSLRLCVEEKAESRLLSDCIPFVSCYRCQAPIAIWEGTGPWICSKRCEEQQGKYGSKAMFAEFAQIYRIVHQFFPLVCQADKGVRNED